MFSEKATKFDRVLEVIGALETLGAYYTIDKIIEKHPSYNAPRDVWVIKVRSQIL